MSTIEEIKRFDEIGRAIRLTDHNGDYLVEYARIEDGEIEEPWRLLGGPLGFANSTFSTEAEAREFFEDLQNLSEEQLFDKYPDIMENEMD